MTQFYIPSRVIQELRTFVLSLDIPKKPTDRFLKELVSLWFFINFKNVEIKAKDSKDIPFVQIHTNQLQQFRVKYNGELYKCNKLLDILSDLNLIEINKSYQVGSHSRSYRPHPDLSFDKLMLHIVDVQNIIKNYSNQEDLVKKYPQYKNRIKDLFNTRVDLDAYIDFLTENLNKPIRRGNKILDATLMYRQLLIALKVNLGLHFFSIADTGRNYTSVANLSNNAIPFLKLYGKPVVEIDAKNSQPLLLASMVHNQSFKEDVQAGLFYEKIQQVLSTELNRDISRDQTKEMTYKYILFNKKLIGPTWKKRLEKIWPGLSDQINEVKKVNELWFELQSREAELWISIACKQKFAVLTKHDSALCHAENADVLKEQLINLYKTKFDLKVTLK